MMTFQAAMTSLASPGRDHHQARHRPERGQMLHRLVRRPVLPHADGVVGEDVDHRQLHERASGGWRPGRNRLKIRKPAP